MIDSKSINIRVVSEVGAFGEIKIYAIEKEWPDLLRDAFDLFQPVRVGACKTGLQRFTAPRPADIR